MLRTWVKIGPDSEIHILFLVPPYSCVRALYIPDTSLYLMINTEPVPFPRLEEFKGKEELKKNP